MAAGGEMPLASSIGQWGIQSPNLQSSPRPTVSIAGTKGWRSLLALRPLAFTPVKSLLLANPCSWGCCHPQGSPPPPPPAAGSQPLVAFQASP